MGFQAFAVAVSAMSAAAQSDQQRSAAKNQARAMQEQANLAAAQAAENSRANGLAAQTAAERERADALVKANAALASATETPDVELATAAPTEAVRRRTVRASFNPEADSAGSIRV